MKRNSVCNRVPIGTLAISACPVSPQKLFGRTWATSERKIDSRYATPTGFRYVELSDQAALVLVAKVVCSDLWFHRSNLSRFRASARRVNRDARENPGASITTRGGLADAKGVAYATAPALQGTGRRRR